MILLIVFAFLAGVVTILSPCILPILPIILSSTVGGQNIGKSRPIGIVVGFIASFTFFTLFLSTIVSLTNIPADSLRIFSVIVIAVFGFSFLIPSLQGYLEKLFSKLSTLIPLGQAKSGFWAGIIIGFSVGLLWTPCVGPILASVITLAITGKVTLDTFLITFAYSLGTAIPMFIIMVGGQNLLRKAPWLIRNTIHIQKTFGVVMIVTAFAIFMNFDRGFQTFILKTFPQYGLGLTKFEDTANIRNKLQRLNGEEVNKDTIGKPMYDLQPKGTKAPEIIPGGVWLNSKPLKLSDLKGKVVVVDFWTYSCINCQRTLPYLKDWYKKYKAKGLVIIGVHSPEFAFEKEESNVRKAIADFGITYPVVQDNNFATWQAYNNQYWPAKYFIDKDGYIRHMHFGEGDYDESEHVIQELLKEAGAKDITEKINNATYQTYDQTHETYLGYARLERFASPEQIGRDVISQYTADEVPYDYVAYEGNWMVTAEYAQPQKGAKLKMNFAAKEVYLVMRPARNASHNDSVGAEVKVFVDDKMQNTITVDADKLYQLIKLPNPGRHMLRLEFQDSNAEVYAFTFG